MGTNANNGVNPKRNLIPKRVNGLGQVVEYGLDTAGGITIREHFAALAMQGLLSSVDVNSFDSYSIAEESVRAADHLIFALNKKA